MWREFCAATGADEALRHDQLTNAKYVWFCSSVSTYNLILAALRTNSAATVSGVTEALRLNFEEYFNTFNGLLDAPKSGPH